MPALVAGIHVFLSAFEEQGVDGRDEPGHDEKDKRIPFRGALPMPRNDAMQERCRRHARSR
jgi:hypothetical protein